MRIVGAGRIAKDALVEFQPKVTEEAENLVKETIKELGGMKKLMPKELSDFGSSQQKIQAVIQKAQAVQKKIMAAAERSKSRADRYQAMQDLAMASQHMVIYKQLRKSAMELNAALGQAVGMDSPAWANVRGGVYNAIAAARGDKTKLAKVRNEVVAHIRDLEAAGKDASYYKTVALPDIDAQMGNADKRFTR